MKMKEYNGSKSVKSLIKNIDEFMSVILDMVENDNHKSNVNTFLNFSETDKEVVDPITHIFDEVNKIIIVIELPGIKEENIDLEVKGNNLNITAKGVKKYYCKKISLKYIPIQENIFTTYHNSIYSIEIKK